MTNPTSYICPKCNQALQFWNHVGGDDLYTPCRCWCPQCGGMDQHNGKGINAREAFADWQKKNAQLKQLS